MCPQLLNDFSLSVSVCVLLNNNEFSSYLSLSLSFVSFFFSGLFFVETTETLTYFHFRLVRTHLGSVCVENILASSSLVISIVW